LLNIEVGKSYGSFSLEASLSVAAGETMALVGPTGCGKTTCLMIIAGILAPDWGRVMLGDRALCDMEKGIWCPPHKRNIGVVFQDYALFPHMTAFDNVAYGLKAKGVRGDTLRKKALAALEMVGIPELAHRKPPQLSGGEKQRLALARAAAVDSPVLLLDEPISALDPHTRDSVRRELKSLISSLGKTTIVVTHDPVDAFTLGQKICVLEGGRVQQIGDSMGLLLYPKTPFVARFMGTNFFSGRVVDARTDGLTEISVNVATVFTADRAEGEVAVSFLPSEVTLSLSRPDGSSLNVFQGTVEDVVNLGDRVRVSIRSDVPIVAEISHRSFAHLGISEGQNVFASFKATAVRAGGGE